MTVERFVFATPGAQRRVMHVQRFTPSGTPLFESICGRSGFNRSINAPWGLGRPVCKVCIRRLEDA